MLQQSPISISEERGTDIGCPHYWIIDAPTGPVSRGECQMCSEVRMFKNYIEAAPWGEDAHGAKSTGGESTVVRADDDGEPFDD